MAPGTPPSPAASDPAAWYHAGLRFTCTQCGNCCSGAPGFTWIDAGEITALAARFGMDEAAFLRRYTRTVWRQGTERVSLVEKRGGDCVFFARDAGCTVYADRPRQCRTWPFWQRIIESPEEWLAAGKECPGIDQGTLHSASRIAVIAADDGLSPPAQSD